MDSCVPHTGTNSSQDVLTPSIYNPSYVVSVSPHIVSLLHKDCLCSGMRTMTCECIPIPRLFGVWLHALNLAIRFIRSILLTITNNICSKSARSGAFCATGKQAVMNVHSHSQTANRSNPPLALWLVCVAANQHDEQDSTIGGYGVTVSTLKDGPDSRDNEQRHREWRKLKRWHVASSRGVSAAYLTWGNTC